MFFRDLKNDDNYFLTNENFVQVSYDGSTLTYNVQLYGRLIQALVDEFDDVKVSLVKGGSFKTKYFQGDTRELVDRSNTSFVQHTREKLQSFISEKTLASQTLSVQSFLPDEMVSMIGSKKINESNYTSHLPQVEIVKVNLNTTPADIPAPDIESFDTLSKRLFQKYGIFPGEVSLVSFPIKKDSQDSDGLGKQVSQVTKKLFGNTDFFDYYQNYFKDEFNTTISRKVRTGLAEYQKFSVDLSIDMETTDEVFLYSKYGRLFIRVALIRDGIEQASAMFPFDNNDLFEEATAGANNVSANILTYDERYVLPDLIEVTNNENFPIEASVFQFSLDENNDFVKDRIMKQRIDPKETLSTSATKIYFDNSESRAYVVTANKFIPGIDGVSNVVKIIKPSTTSATKRNPGNISLNVVPGNENSVTITLSGLTSNEYSAKLFRYRIGDIEKTYLGNMTFPAGKFTDQNVYTGEVYVYEAIIEYNGAGNFGRATTGHVSYHNNSLSRIFYSITDQTTRKAGRGVAVHSFKIAETVASTTPEKLLQTVGASGEAGNYEKELESVKQSTTVISVYSIYRLNSKTGAVEYLGEAPAGKKLQYAVVAKSSKDINYVYYILPKSSETGAISYKTIVEESDIGTGKAFKYRYKKWRDKNYNRAQVLPSFSEVVDDNIAAALSNLPEGAAVTAEFTGGSTRGGVFNLTALARESSSCTFISWSYRGSLENILYFVVMAKYKGVKAPIGLSVPDETASRGVPYSYCDEKLSLALGDVAYSIVPVMLDGTKGKESKAVKVKTMDNYPDEALLANE